MPIVGVCLSKHAFPYDFDEANAFLSDLDETLATAAPGAHELLREHGVSAPPYFYTRCAGLSPMTLPYLILPYLTLPYPALP